MVQTIARFLNLKNEFGFETSYESAMADLRELGLKPDATFFSVFIKRSCERGDMEETGHYLKAMHQAGAVPNDYIFSKILHGYVKCGLPDEVAVTQDVMSKLNYWPSTKATEDLLLAYADLGDGNSVIELIQETLNKSEDLANVPVFSPRFLADLYVRLSMSQAESDEEAFVKILDLLKKRPPSFDDFRLGNALTRLLQEGKIESALQLLRNTRPLNFSTYFLTRIPEILAKQDSNVLNDFWVASGAISRLPEIIRYMTMENIFRTMRANPPLRTDTYNSVANIAVMKAVRFKDIDSVVELGKILGVHKPHLLYLSVVPRLLSLGLKPEEILAKFEPPLRSSAALGIVLSDLCAFKSFYNPPQSGHSLENANILIEEYQKQGLLPFSKYLSVNSNLIFLLLRGFRHYAEGGGKELNTSKVDAWMDALFSCFPHERRPLLAGALLRFFGQNQQELPSESSSGQANSAIDKTTNLSLARTVVQYFDKKKIPISYLDLVKKSLKNLGLPEENFKCLIPAGTMSKHAVFVSKIQAGAIDDVTEELMQMQKSISQETSALGPIDQFDTDILGEAFAVSTPVAGAEGKKVTPAPQHFTPQQMENLFWALLSVSGVKSPKFSAAKIGELYLNGRDLEGLVKFMNRMADQCPQHLSVILSRWFISKIVELDAARAGQIMEEVLQKPNVSISSMVLGAYNYELCQVGSENGGDMAPPSHLGIKLLPARLETFNHLRKVRSVHSAVEDLCLNNHIFAAYALRNWAWQIGLTLLPQTTETLLASHVLMNAVPRIPIDLLAPERLVIRGGVSLAGLIPRIRDAITMVNSNQTVDEATMLAAVNDVTKALAEHSFVTDSSDIAQTMRPAAFKQAQFAFWSAVSQALDSAGSRITSPENLARIANGLITEGHEAAVLSWISCLLRTDKIAALCCGALASKNNKLAPENVTVLIDVVRKLWGPGRIDLLLCHLVELKANESVEQVVGSLTTELRDRRVPFKTLCSLLKLNTSGEAASSNEQFVSLVEELKAYPSQSLTLCMNGPHVSTLFHSWPELRINDALDVIGNTLERFQSILRLQLAASLVHRGLLDKASPIIEKSGPLPFNYLAGSLNHPLNKSSYHNSFQYLKATDPEHLAAFVDASLRNAAMSARSSASSEVVVGLLKAAMEESPTDLKSFCQPSTLRILNEATKNCEEIQQALFKKSDPNDKQK
ncbi:unnamed protein product [Rodentolepis nana]|uniref:PPR_long domain-containing protein n=1 Tax=Rodentolepis nana TaxID=102285 RepID=A0A158QI04_RODNA|nr:unnamed protein product [Rodentolepis nana]